MKYLFYLLPGLLDMVEGLFFFITVKRMADAGASSLAVTATIPAWGLIYAGTTLVLSKFLTRRNAVGILFISHFILLGAMSGMLLAPSVYAQYFWLILCGLGTGLFFAPFQAVVKLLEKIETTPLTFARSTAIYTFSWSIGMALGPTVAALLWGALDREQGWRTCYWVNIAAIIFSLGALVLMARFVRARLGTEKPSPSANAQEEQTSAVVHPDLMISAWVLGLGGFLVLALLRVYLPDYATKVLKFPTAAQGIIVGLISYAQAFTGLACLKTRRWPYHPWMGMLGGICGVAALVLFAFGCTIAAASIAAILCGIFSGIFCFNFTYHALANADKSAKYAAVNETIAGATSVLAPLGAGLLADHTTAVMPFLVSLAIIAVTLAGHTALTWKTRHY